MVVKGKLINPNLLKTEDGLYISVGIPTSREYFGEAFFKLTSQDGRYVITEVVPI